MKQENRHQAILYAVMRQGYVSIESLAEELGVSSQTIRRDISELDRTGMLERRPGGASCRTTILNSTYDARQVEDFKDKERIARTIAEYIPDNSSIFLTLGTTVEVIAYALLERSGLMVITNNVVAALTLNKKTDFEVVLASGYMRKSSNGLVGESTIEFVNGFQCDYVIIRNQYAIPRIQECQRDMQDTFFGADEWLDLCFRVQVYVIPRLVPIGESLTQFRYAHVRLITDRKSVV